MTWEIRVWHEVEGERSRISIEAGINVPDNVISDVAGSYWFEEVQGEADWTDGEPFDGGDGAPNQRLQG
ncbi:MAG: hypothetical protein ACR2JC_14630 [Chloroflexota bacterium]|nr:MAG: hypothetical protein DLM70_17750 [Chloroflexota bacterium]